MPSQHHSWEGSGETAQFPEGESGLSFTTQGHYVLNQELSKIHVAAELGLPFVGIYSNW